MPGREFFVYEVSLGERMRHLISPLNPDQVFEHGLSNEAIFGMMALGVGGPSADAPADGLLADHFQENPAFVRFLHDTIADDIFVVDTIREQARLIGQHGWVPLLDARTPDPAGEVPPEDVIGMVEVRDGGLVPLSYRPNAEHRLYTSNGFFQLPEALEMALLKRILDRQSAGRALDAALED